MKTEGTMSELLSHAAAPDCDQSDLRTKMKKYVLHSTFMNKREVSAQEAVFRFMSLTLKISSKLCSFFVNTSLPKHRIGMLKSKAEIAKLPEKNILWLKIMLKNRISVFKRYKRI